MRLSDRVVFAFNVIGEIVGIVVVLLALAAFFGAYYLIGIIKRSKRDYQG